jgi:hypothetical protein
MKSSAEKQELWMHMWVVSGKSLAGRIRLKQFPESVTDLRWIYETLNKDLFSDYMYHSVGIVRDLSLYHLLLEKSEYTEYQQL